MGQDPYRALVVDDEATVRHLAVRALTRRGFSCETAEDGAVALERLEAGPFDVVVTDLRMPRRHGHALAVDLLGRDNRPAVVVVTGVAEPKLANDLIIRGVDDVVFKPVDYSFLALKIKMLVDRRREARKSQSDLGTQANPLAGVETGDGNGPVTIVENDSKNVDVNCKLAHLSKVLPVSQAAFDVFGMANSNDYDSQQIAAAIARDPSLSVDVLRLANSSFYNPSGDKVVDLEKAVVRIGQKRIGELALATSALAALTHNVLPWMSVSLAWRRSVAAGVAADLLLAQRGHSEAQAGVFLSSIMHPLGRIALGTLYPREYGMMVETCNKDGGTLVELERSRYSVTHGEVMSRLLETWNIPVAVHEPLRHVADTFPSLRTLPEPLRTQTELTKLAITIGWITVDKWESWDRLEFPPSPVLQRLATGSLSDIIRETKRDTERIIDFQIPAPAREEETDATQKSEAASRELAYCNLSSEPFDFLAEVVPSMGINLRTVGADALGSESHALINCVSAPPGKLAAHLDHRAGQGAKLIVAGPDDTEPYTQYGEVVPLPSSYATLCQACLRIAAPLPGDGHRGPGEGHREPARLPLGDPRPAGSVLRPSRLPPQR